MYFQKLSLLNFKNHKDLSLEFSSQINCIYGKNGVGKTNILDALHYLALCKSYFHHNDIQSVFHDENMMMISGELNKSEYTYRVSCSLQKPGKKSMFWEKAAYEKFSEHIGKIPLVMITPGDINLLIEGSEERRKFIDATISQIDRNYLRDLQNYAALIVQRNAQIKKFNEQHRVDRVFIEIMDERIYPLAKKIHEKRAEFIKELWPLFSKFYNFISGDVESAEINYVSNFNPDMDAKQFVNSLEKDLQLNRTQIGIHKDDFDFLLQGRLIRKFGSQGQVKSFLIAIKLAQYYFLAKKSKEIPILCLDDIFEKIDQNRAERLMELTGSMDFGQIFITDTHPERLKNALNKTEKEIRFIEL